MLKFADQSRDLGGQDTHKVLTVFTAPDFVKKASTEERCGGTSLSAGAYADSANKLYPCHTAAATWLSTAFFLNKRAEVANADHVASLLAESARYHGITGEIAALTAEVEKVGQHSELGLPDADFALIIEYDDNRRERKYPMRNALETKAAAEYLHKYRAEFPYPDRQKIAQKILLKAAEYGADIRERRDELERTAGRGVGSINDTVDVLMTRARVVGHRQGGSEPAAQLSKMAAVISDHPEQFQHFDKLSELAAAMDEIDRHFGLTLRYGQGTFDFPEDTLFAINEKLAADLSHELVSTTTGSVYKRADLLALPLEQVRDVMGDDFADAVSIAGVALDGEKLAEVVPTLPRPDAERLDLLLATVGKPAFGKQAAGGFSRMADPEVKSAAAAYVPPAPPGSLWAKYRPAASA